ncbi:cell wall protein [Streptomyces atratus]|uniref:cell wall protein n=1 Tax=Streptomyces atratus TaxID=1893 RepID=UPI0037B52FA8
MATTAARHAQPKAWLRAVVWLVDDLRLHPRAGRVTLLVARDLAGRMDYIAGTVLYDLAGTAARCGVSRATVKRHVGYLRELGALAWVRHGTRTNLRLPGRPYAGTATIYAATIPAAYDKAQGNRVEGAGFTARVVGVAEAEAWPVDNSTAHTSGGKDREPQSLTGHPMGRREDVGGGLKDTPRKRARRRTASPSNNSASHRRPWQLAQDIQVARRVRPLVRWTQGEGLRRLAFALRPLIDRGLEAHDIAAELTSWWLDWCPARPAAYITARLRDRAAWSEVSAEDAHPDATGPAGNPAWQAWLQQRATGAAFAEPDRTDDDRRRARLSGWDQWPEVANHYETDPDDALDLYGTRLCCYAIRCATRARVRTSGHP